MNKPYLRNKPLTLILGAGLGLGAIGSAQASSLFQASDLAAGYAVASAEDGKKSAEGGCGEAGCGAHMGGGSADKAGDADKKKAADKGEQAPPPPPKK